MSFWAGVRHVPCAVQALMGGRQFCALLQGLQAAAPALPPSELPTLHALSALAAEFLESPAADAPGVHPSLAPAVLLV